MPVRNIACITPESEDDRTFFCSSIAINHKYLALGDRISNRIVIYTRHNSVSWERTKIIKPPQNSPCDRESFGFGKKLQLEGDSYR